MSDAASGPAAPAGAADAEALWLRHRGLVFAVAYDILGTVADAEDVAQETWIRFSAAVGSTVIREPRGYLASIAARLALNAARAMRRRRETYVGPWLPEPLPGPVGPPESVDPETAAMLADDVSMALLVVLQTLGPEERVAFVLREVFGVGYPEIARALGRSQPATRQVVHRARERVHAQRQRVEVTPAEHLATVERFGRALAAGDLGAVLEVLAPDVLFVADGGGKAWAAGRPVGGSDAVVRLLTGFIRLEGDRSVTVPVAANGRVAVAIVQDGATVSLFQYLVTRDDAGDHRISAIYVTRNPDKLARFRLP